MIGQAFFFTLLCNSFFFPSDPFDSLFLFLRPFATYDSRLPSPLPPSFHRSRRWKKKTHESWCNEEKEREKWLQHRNEWVFEEDGEGKNGKKERDCVSVCVHLGSLFIWSSCGRKGVQWKLKNRFPLSVYFSLTYGEHFVNLSHGKRDRDKRSWDQKNSGTGYPCVVNELASRKRFKLAITRTQRIA